MDTELAVVFHLVGTLLCLICKSSHLNKVFVLMDTELAVVFHHQLVYIDQLQDLSLVLEDSHRLLEVVGTLLCLICKSFHLNKVFVLMGTELAVVFHHQLVYIDQLQDLSLVLEDNHLLEVVGMNLLKDHMEVVHWFHLLEAYSLGLLQGHMEVVHWFHLLEAYSLGLLQGHMEVVHWFHLLEACSLDLLKDHMEVVHWFHLLVDSFYHKIVNKFDQYRIEICIAQYIVNCLVEVVHPFHLVDLAYKHLRLHRLLLNQAFHQHRSLMGLNKVF